MSRILANLKSLPIQGVNEAVTLAKLIDPILREAGFDTEDIKSVEEEFSVEIDSETVIIDRCLKRRGKTLVFLQAKQVGRKNLFKNDVSKTRRVASKYQVPFIIFTDGVFWELNKMIGLQPLIDYEKYMQINLSYYPSKYQEIITALKSLSKDWG